MKINILKKLNGKKENKNNLKEMYPLKDEVLEKIKETKNDSINNRKNRDSKNKRRPALVILSIAVVLILNIGLMSFLYNKYIFNSEMDVTSNLNHSNINSKKDDLNNEIQAKNIANSNDFFNGSKFYNLDMNPDIKKENIIGHNVDDNDSAITNNNIIVKTPKSFNSHNCETCYFLDYINDKNNSDLKDNLDVRARQNNAKNNVENNINELNVEDSVQVTKIQNSKKLESTKLENTKLEKAKLEKNKSEKDKKATSVKEITTKTSKQKNINKDKKANVNKILNEEKIEVTSNNSLNLENNWL